MIIDDIANKLSAITLPRGAKVYKQHAPLSAPVPFVVVALNSMRHHTETTLDEGDDTRTGRVLITATAGTPQGAEALANEVRLALSPGRLSTPVGAAMVRWVAREYSDIDTDVFVPGTKLHPAYCVHSYEFVTD